jgi:peptide deformylase
VSFLRIRKFGDPVLRETANPVPVHDIASPKIQVLITDMKKTLLQKNLGIGLAAPQVGKRMALAVIAIRPSEHRPSAKPFDLVIINPEITEMHGRKKQLWEGCISSGSMGKADLFAQVPRYKDIKLRYLDQNGKDHHKKFSGIQAHVIQHEVDHLNGILFVDRVKNTKSYMTYSEYMKMAKQKLSATKQ